MKIHGDGNSGNCLKVKWVCDWLALPYHWVDVDLLKGETRTHAFLSLNPAGQVPAIVLDDGRTLAESNAIIRYLARGSDLIPTDPYDAAKMDQWLFWEQYSHEPYIAVCRFQMVYLGRPASALDPDKVKRGYAALDHCGRSFSWTDAGALAVAAKLLDEPGTVPYSARRDTSPQREACYLEG